MKNKLIPLALGLLVAILAVGFFVMISGPNTPVHHGPPPSTNVPTTPAHPGPTPTPVPTPPPPGSTLDNADCVSEIVTEAFVKSCEWTVEYAQHPAGNIAPLTPPTYSQFMFLEKAGSTVFNNFVTDVDSGNGGKYLNQPYATAYYEMIQGAATVKDSSPGCIENVTPYSMGGVFSFNGTFAFADYQPTAPLEYVNCGGTKTTLWTKTSLPTYGYWTLTSDGLLQSGLNTACTPGIGYSPSGCAWEHYITSPAGQKAAG